MKRLEEIRDRLVREYSYRHAKRIAPEDSHACYVSGFDAALKELMPMVEELVEALKQIEEDSCDYLHDHIAEDALNGWRKFKGEE